MDWLQEDEFSRNRFRKTGDWSCCLEAGCLVKKAVLWTCSKVIADGTSCLNNSRSAREIGVFTPRVYGDNSISEHTFYGCLLPSARRFRS